MATWYVGDLPDATWHAVLGHYLAQADVFHVHMPEGEGDLSAGRAEFEALPGVTVRPWTGMRDAVEIVGPVTPQAKAIFESHEKSMLERSGNKLWDYQLFSGAQELLYIGDFSDLLITEPDLSVLRRLGVDTEALDSWPQGDAIRVDEGGTGS